MNQIIMILIANVCLLLALALFFYKSWLDIIRPDWFYVFKIMEHDRTNYTEHKLFLPLVKRKDSYVIDGSEYNKIGKRPMINSRGVYEWIFFKNELRPCVLSREDDNIIDGKLVAEAKKLSLDDIWFNSTGIEDFLKTYGILILAFIIVIFMIYSINTNQKTTELILNVTRMRK